MDWEAVGAIGEILGALGVIVTVGYLAIQVRQNTQALHTASYQHDSDQMNRLNIAIVENPQFAEIMTKAIQDHESLSGPEWTQFNAFLFANFHVFETLYHGYCAGTVPENLWRAEENGLRTMINQPGVSVWWNDMLKFGPYTPEFRDHVESLKGDRVEAFMTMVESPNNRSESADE